MKPCTSNRDARFNDTVSGKTAKEVVVKMLFSVYDDIVSELDFHVCRLTQGAFQSTSSQPQLKDSRTLAGQAKFLLTSFILEIGSLQMCITLP